MRKETIYKYLTEQIGDDAEMLQMLFDKYLETMQEKLPQLETAIAEGDFTKIKPLAHSLKGDTAVVGDMVANEVAVAFDLAAKAENLEQCKVCQDKIVALVQELSN